MSNPQTSLLIDPAGQREATLGSDTDSLLEIPFSLPSSFSSSSPKYYSTLFSKTQSSHSLGSNYASSGGISLPSGPFIRLQAKLKKERLFVTGEKQGIQALYGDLNSLTHDLMSASWRSRGKQWSSYLFIHNLISWAQWEERVIQAKKVDPEFVEAYTKLQPHTHLYEALLNAAYYNPQDLALCLFHNPDFSSNHMKQEEMIRFILFSLYGNHFLPFEDVQAIALMEKLVDLQFNSFRDAKCSSFLKQANLFSRYFSVYSKEYNPQGTQYLIAALREPLLEVLADDDLDLEIEPTVVWGRLDEKAKENMFGSSYPSLIVSAANLLENEKFKQLMDRIYDRLISLCQNIVESLYSSLHSFPYSIRWVSRHIASLLRARGVKQAEIRTCLGDLLLLRFIGPAVASPESYGIIVDTPVSPSARRNLRLIAKVLRDVTREAFNAHREPHMAPFYDRLMKLGSVNIGGFFDAIIDVHAPPAVALEFPTGSVQHRGRRRALALATRDLDSLIKLVKGCFHVLEPYSELRLACVALPPSHAALDDPHGEANNLIVITLGIEDEWSSGGILGEKEFMASTRKLSVITLKSGGAPNPFHPALKSDHLDSISLLEKTPSTINTSLMSALNSTNISDVSSPTTVVSPPSLKVFPPSQDTEMSSSPQKRTVDLFDLGPINQGIGSDSHSHANFSVSSSTSSVSSSPLRPLGHFTPALHPSNPFLDSNSLDSPHLSSAPSMSPYPSPLPSDLRPGEPGLSSSLQNLYSPTSSLSSATPSRRPSAANSPSSSLLSPIQGAPPLGPTLKRPPIPDGVGGEMDDESGLLNDAVTHLRAALSEMPFPLSWKYLTLSQVLEAHQAEADQSGNGALATLLEEALRSLQRLPPRYLVRGGELLLTRMYEDYQGRAPYVAYLVATRQSLLITRDALERQAAFLTASLAQSDKFFNLMRVRRFVESEAEALRVFMATFSTIDMIDDKSAAIRGFLDALFEKFEELPSFASMTDVEVEEARELMGQQLICAVYKTMFYPHDSDREKDQLFYDHVKNHLHDITMDHPLIQISKGHRKGAPWSTAQRMLLRINAYKTPSDKLTCITQCCQSIMHTVQLSGVSASADDILPILVYVLVRANPPHLLSTIQYIKYFGGQAADSGESGYWFTQFCSSVMLIQSIDDRPQKKTPKK